MARRAVSFLILAWIAIARPAIPQPTEASLALRKLRVAPGLKVELFAAEPQLVNPVAFCIDERGRFYVAETQRFGITYIDIRKHMGWLDRDLAFRTSGERRAFYLGTLGPNLRDMETVSERIRLIEDVDGDGRADRATTFAEDFRDPAATVASGVLARGGDVWAAVAPDLWRLRDADGDGKADSRKALLSGFGVHIGFSAHDLHGLIFGPDGKLYFSMGDRGIHVETEGRTIANPDSGGVLRCNPDGSGLELVAFGMRNPQELAFDAQGNLWTGENTADVGDQVRWVYVVEGGDCGWRFPYQYLPSGGLWLSEGISEGRAPYTVPPVDHIGHGPSGLAFYPGTGLPEAYDDHFLLCDFPGGVQSFAVKPKGASFEMVDRQTFLWDLWPTDVAFGPEGGAYVSDWVEGWKPPQKGRIFRVFDPEAAKGAPVREVKRLLAEGMDGRSVDDLAGLLAHRDQRVRQAAQFALAGQGAGPALAMVAAGQAPGRGPRADLARLHAIWGLGQIGENPPEALYSLLPLLKDADAEVRAQAAKVLGERRFERAYDEFVALLKDPSLRVRLFAALGLGKLGRKEAVGPLIDMLRENADRDATLRHAGVMGLTWIFEKNAGDIGVEALVEAGKDKSAAVRMASLLTMRRLGRAEIAMFLDDPAPSLAFETARAIHDVPVDAALPALAERLRRKGWPEAAASRAIRANVRLGTAEAAARLAAFAGGDAPASARAEALRALGEWTRPPGRDRVTGFWRPLPRRDAPPARDALRPALEALFNGPSDAVGIEAARAAAALGIAEAGPLLDALCRNRDAAPDVRAAALQALADLKNDRFAGAREAAMGDPDAAVRREAIRLLVRAGPADAAARLGKIAADEGSVSARQAALVALGGMEGPGADAALAALLDKLLAGRLAAPLHLDLLEAAARRHASDIKDRLARYEAARPKDDPLAAYRETREGGDPLAGRDVFYGQCARCHRMKLRGGEVGPPLTAIGGLRTREQLLESILLPNKEIAPGYEQAVIVTEDEITEVGRVVSEDADVLVLQAADGKPRVIPKSGIRSRARGLSAMPEDMVKVLSKRNLRDVVAFLATGPDNPQAESLPEGAVVVDNDEPFRCSPVGNWREGPVGGDYGWSSHRAAPDPAGASKLIWEWTLPKPGRYHVYVWHGGTALADPATGAGQSGAARLAGDAPFMVEHLGGKETVRVDLTKDAGSWKLLGTFPYNTTDHARVVLTNAANGVVIGDAVKYVPE